MSRTPKSKLLTPFLEAASQQVVQDCWDVPAGLVSRCVERFCRRHGAMTDELRDELDRVADEFAMDRSAAPYFGKPGYQKELLKRLRDGEDAEQVLRALAPEYTIALTQYLYRQSEDGDWLIHSTPPPAGEIARVREAAGRLWADFQPGSGRAVDLPLETAIRSLVKLLTAVLGHVPQVHGNKNNGKSGPTPSCAGAELIHDLLRGIDKQLTTTTVMNMLSRVKQQPSPSRDPLLTLIEANPINALDASLFTRTQGSDRRVAGRPHC